MSFVKGYKLSEETRKKMSASAKGHIVSLETRKKIGNANRGRLASRETLLKLSKVHKGKKRPPFSDEWKQKISNSLRGDKSPCWKGGLSILNKHIRDCFKYRQWRSDVFTRDNFICQRCFKKELGLEAHHIKEFSLILKENNIKTVEDALSCEELWNINNGITFCKKCHEKTKNFGSKIKNKVTI